VHTLANEGFLKTLTVHWDVVVGAAAIGVGLAIIGVGRIATGAGWRPPGVALGSGTPTGAINLLL
jgi:hypothetical protein